MNKKKFEELLAQLGLDPPTTRDEVMEYAVALAVFGELSGEIENGDEETILNELMAVYEGTLREGVRVTKKPGWFSNGENEVFDKYVDNENNRKLNRVGQEYNHRKFASDSKIKQVGSKIAGVFLNHPRIAATLLTVAVGLGVFSGIHAVNEEDFQQYHNCTNAICQTYEHGDSALSPLNGALHTGKGAIANRQWKRQQRAIADYHKGGHVDKKYDSNGMLPGGEEEDSLVDYIMRHAPESYHATPSLQESKLFQMAYRIRLREMKA